MNILIIDGQGGALGRQLVKQISERFPQASLRAVGTNSMATASMMKGGPVVCATGENAIRVGCRWADVIVGPIGIVIADALLGEVTPAAASAVGSSDAARILIPMNRCDTIVAGVGAAPLSVLIADACDRLAELIENA